MTREILFRGKRTDNGEWIEGYYAKQSNHACFEYELKYTHFIYKDVFMDFGLGGLCEAEVIPETVGQYTGLTDKNGKKIFEGDICKVAMFTCECEDDYLCEVCFECGSFVFRERSGFDILFLDIYDFNTDVEVIGNIYDNPELIGERK